MENLWPSDLFVQAPRSDIEDIARLLSVQAEAIRNQSDGLIAALVKKESYENMQSWSFGLYPPSQPTKCIDLFVVRVFEEKLPAVVESYVSESDEIKECNSISALKRSVKAIFSYSRTKRLVKLLAQDSKDAGIAPHQEPMDDSVQVNRSILIGSIVQTEERDFTHIAISNVSGFIDAKEVRRLLMAPDEEGSPIETLNERFVVTIRFLESFKLNLSDDELKVLQTEARRALNHTYLSVLAAGVAARENDSPRTRQPEDADFLGLIVTVVRDFCRVYIPPASASVSNQEDQFIRALSEFLLASDPYIFVENRDGIEATDFSGFDLALAKGEERVVIEIKQRFSAGISRTTIDRLGELMASQRVSSGIVLFLPRKPQELNFEVHHVGTMNTRVAVLWPSNG